MTFTLRHFARSSAPGQASPAASPGPLPHTVVSLMGPADSGTAVPVMGSAPAGTVTPVMGPADTGTATPMTGPADTGTAVPVMGAGAPNAASVMSPRRQ
jgi:hypothetical protein